MKTEMLTGETVTKSGAANMQRGPETVGGKLYLTNLRLIFESHAFNIQTGATIVALQDISETRRCWTKFLNLIPVAPNSLAVFSSGEEKRFVLFGRSAWKIEIDQQRQRMAAGAH